MERELEIELGLLLASDYYMQGGFPKSQVLIDACVGAYTRDRLEPDTKKILDDYQRFKEVRSHLKQSWGVASPSVAEVLSAMDALAGVELPVSLWKPLISNADRYPYTDWNEDVEIVGSVGAENLFLLGYEQGTMAAIVGRSAEEEPETLHAMYLYELMMHSQEAVVVSKKLKSGAVEDEEDA